ncbi:MAG: hypothetical protein U1F20_04675 [Lysobacterales bacterium]
MFSQQVRAIEDRQKLLAIVKALGLARELHNLVRLGSHAELAQLMDFDKLRQLHRRGAARAGRAQPESASSKKNPTASALLDQALEDVIFEFEKVGEGELKIADGHKDALRRTREALAASRIRRTQWIALKEEAERLFKNKLSAVGEEEMQDNIAALGDIEQRTRQPRPRQRQRRGPLRRGRRS